jgi:hypothetical protein
VGAGDGVGLVEHLGKPVSDFGGAEVVALEVFDEVPLEQVASAWFFNNADFEVAEGVGVFFGEVLLGGESSAAEDEFDEGAVGGVDEVADGGLEGAFGVTDGGDELGEFVGVVVESGVVGDLDPVNGPCLEGGGPGGGVDGCGCLDGAGALDGGIGKGGTHGVDGR